MKTKTEIIYRSKPTKKHPKGERWRVIENKYRIDGYWCMERVKDGHWLYHKPENLTEE